MPAQATPVGGPEAPCAYGPQVPSTIRRFALRDGRGVLIRRFRQRPGQPVSVALETRKGRTEATGIFTAEEAREVAAALLEAAS